MNSSLASRSWWLTLSLPRTHARRDWQVRAMLAVLLRRSPSCNPILSVANNIDARAELAEQQLDVDEPVAQGVRCRECTGLSAVEEQIRANPQKRNLLTLLESLASNSSVKINSMEERKAQEDEKFKETRVEVRLKRVTLEAAVSYLHAIEASDQLLTVKSLKMKNRTDRSNSPRRHLQCFDLRDPLEDMARTESILARSDSEVRKDDRDMPIAAVLLTTFFILLGFPYDLLADRIALQVESALGVPVEIGGTELRLGLLGTGLRVQRSHHRPAHRRK